MKETGYFPQLGFSTNVFDNPADIAATVEQILAHFTDIEIELEDAAESVVFDSSESDYRQLVCRLRGALSAGARQISVHAPYLSRSTDLAACDEDVRSGAVEQVRRAVRFCADIGGDRVTYHPGFMNKGDDKTVLTANLKRSIEALQKEASALGVKLCLENMGNSRPKYLVYSPEEHLALHRETGTWVTLDLVHLATWCDTVEEMNRQMALYAPVTANIHVNDKPAGRHRHVPLGQGVLPVADMLRTMGLLGYRGAAIIDEFARPTPAYEYLHGAKQFLAASNAWR